MYDGKKPSPHAPAGVPARPALRRLISRRLASRSSSSARYAAPTSLLLRRLLRPLPVLLSLSELRGRGGAAAAAPAAERGARAGRGVVSGSLRPVHAGRLGCHLCMPQRLPRAAMQRSRHGGGQGALPNACWRGKAAQPEAAGEPTVPRQARGLSLEPQICQQALASRLRLTRLCRHVCDAHHGRVVWLHNQHSHQLLRGALLGGLPARLAGSCPCRGPVGRQAARGARTICPLCQHSSLPPPPPGPGHGAAAVAPRGPEEQEEDEDDAPRGGAARDGDCGRGRGGRRRTVAGRTANGVAAR